MGDRVLNACAEAKWCSPSELVGLAQVDPDNPAVELVIDELQTEAGNAKESGA